jgi:hypothetical protein
MKLSLYALSVTTAAAFAAIAPVASAPSAESYPIVVAPKGPEGPQFYGYPVQVERPTYQSYARPYYARYPSRSRRAMLCEGGGWVWTGGWGLLDQGWGYYAPTPDYVYVPERCYR